MDIWLQELREHAEQSIVVCLVANKMDLFKSNPTMISRSEGMEYAKSNGMLYKESSALWDRGLTQDEDKIKGGIEYTFEDLIQ